MERNVFVCKRLTPKQEMHRQLANAARDLIKAKVGEVRVGQWGDRQIRIGGDRAIDYVEACEKHGISLEAVKDAAAKKKPNFSGSA